MKTILSVMFFLLSSNIVYSQKEVEAFLLQDTVKKELDRYNNDFLGTWIATSGDDVYEITFEQRMLYYQMIDKHTMMIIGSIKKKRDGKVVYNRRVSNEYVQGKNDFPLCGSVMSLNVLVLRYSEPGENKELGELKFILSADKQTATWVLKPSPGLKLKKFDRFEIPYNMTFKRKKDKK